VKATRHLPHNWSQLAFNSDRRAMVIGEELCMNSSVLAISRDTKMK